MAVIYVGAAGNQERGGVVVVVDEGGVEGGVVLAAFSVREGARVKELADDFSVAAEGGIIEGVDAIGVWKGRS